jgi:hypothetical protein
VANRPDGLTVVITRLCKYGNPGDIKTISYSTADQLVIRQYAVLYDPKVHGPLPWRAGASTLTAQVQPYITPPSVPLPDGPKTFALVSNITNGVGLQKDTEVLKALLESYGHTVYTEMWNATSPTFRRVNVLIFLEVIDHRWFPYADTAWLVPNSEWWYPEAWNRHLPRFSKVLCKTKHCHELWKPMVGGRAIYTGFEAVDFLRPDIERNRTFLHLAGKSATKNTEAVLAAWREFKIPYLLLAVIANRDLATHGQGIPGVTVVERLPDVTQAMNANLFHIMPSQQEGYGHALHESLGCGAVVITTAAPPMNEFSGIPRELTIPVHRTMPKCIAQLQLVQPSDVAAAVNRAWSLSEQDVSRIREEARAGFLADRSHFRSQMAAIADTKSTAHTSTGRDLVLVPTYFRPEYLWNSLEALAAADGGKEKEVWISHDHHARDYRPADPENKEVVEHFKGAFAALRWIDRQPTIYDGNSYNVLELYREAYGSNAKFVYLIEDDVIVEKDFFRWHEAVQAKGDYICSWAGGHESDEGKDPSIYVETSDHYSSLGTCWRREKLGHVLPHANPAYYTHMYNYVTTRFPGIHLDRGFVEQDNLIKRIIMAGHHKAAFPLLKRAYHIGITGYHRLQGYKFQGPLEQRAKELGEAARAGRLQTLPRTHVDCNDIDSPRGSTAEWSELHVQ